MTHKLTPEKLTAFLAVLADTCNVGASCDAIDISRYTAYKWRKDMPDFAEAWEDAMKAGVTRLEDEAHRRAFDGVEDPLTHQGQFTYLYRVERDEDGEPVLDDNGQPKQVPVLDKDGNHKVAAVRKYSDTLAIFLLKAHHPEKYRENSKVELSGHLATSDMTEDEIRAELAALVSAGIVPATQDDADDGYVCDLV